MSLGNGICSTLILKTHNSNNHIKGYKKFNDKNAV